MTIYHIIVVLYLLCSVFFILYLWTQKNSLLNTAITIGFAAFSLHTVFYILTLAQGNTIVGGLSKSLFFFSWFVVLVYFLSRLKFKAPIMGTFVFPLAFIASMPSLIVPKGIIQSEATLNNPWILSHIILIFFGEAFFVIAFIAGILHIYEERKIKNKKIKSSLKKLPSLTTLDRIIHFSILLGFPFVTIGLALGLFLATHIWGPEWKWGLKENLSLITWVLYAVLIHGRLHAGWKGNKSALGAIIGFIIILFTIIIGYLVPSQHSF